MCKSQWYKLKLVMLHVNVGHMWIFAEIGFFVECVEHNGTCILACYLMGVVIMCTCCKSHIWTLIDGWDHPFS